MQVLFSVEQTVAADSIGREVIGQNPPEQLPGPFGGADDARGIAVREDRRMPLHGATDGRDAMQGEATLEQLQITGAEFEPPDEMFAVTGEYRVHIVEVLGGAGANIGAVLEVSMRLRAPG